MKWKYELIIQTTIIFQLLFLFYTWWSKFITREGSIPYIIAIVIIIGFIGGALMRLQKTKYTKENKNLFTIIRLVGALISTISVYLALIPIITIFYQSKASALLLMFGFLSSWLISKLPVIKGTQNA